MSATIYFDYMAKSDRSAFARALEEYLSEGSEEIRVVTGTHGINVKVEGKEPEYECWVKVPDLDEIKAFDFLKERGLNPRSDPLQED